MKRLTQLFSLFFLLLIFSCSNDDNVSSNDDNVHFTIKTYSEQEHTIDVIITYGTYDRKENKTILKKLVIKDFKEFTSPKITTDQTYAFLTVEKLNDPNLMTFIKINSFVNDRDIMTNASNKEFTNAEVDIKHFANMHKK
ncbi:hypothetical protein HX063_07815 [Myroides odoratimimus]|uniref:hypothetical protein n=1 Tax=Myroides TaxID=76831 RepID=UPI000280AAE2|nr:hypothetical protein [Myroides odoratimimus]EKB03152.1 hypothetical protein HMPREF9711_02479 [Myroides odoratimimus CCUG 3837]MDM1495316.1 hypothetical protein [Myroides odoratimimus]